MDTVVALDVGGTKLAAALVGEDASIHRRAVVPTPAHGSAEEMWAAVTSLLDPLAGRSPAVGTAAGPAAGVAIGVGSGGPMTSGGVSVSPLNIPAWRDFPLLGRLSERYGLPVRVDNDAKALAAGEARWGAAVGVDDFIAMVVSTGVGGGIVLGGELLDGADGNAGHIGHVIVEPDGRPCACGARGCLEAEASGTAIAAITGRPSAEAPVEVRRRTGTLVGRAVASVANLLDLRLALVAGSVALGFGDDFFEAASAELDRSARLTFCRGAVIRPGGLGADGPLLGAAAVGFRALVTHE
ncbi:MAG: ROK family protein [Acidimicrobiales bacterium]